MAGHRERFGPSSQTLYLIDVSSFIFRAFFAIRALHNRAGVPTNAVYGVATMLSKLMEQAHPEYVAVAYDSKEPSFRKAVYSDYKANRSAPPEDLIPQFDLIEKLVQKFKMFSYRQSGVEADDLIATLTRRWLEASKEHSVVIVTGDKDLMQLVGDRVCVWDTMNDRIFSAKEVEEKFGVRPDQVRDYLAMVGDSSDNIPGIPSVGPKTAADLLKEHGTLDGVLDAARAGKISGKKGETIRAHEKDALLSQRLATVMEEIPVDVTAEQLRYKFHVDAECLAFLSEMDFGSLVKRWTAQYAEPESSAPAPAPESPAVPPAAEFRTINTETDFQALIDSIERRKEFGFDVETTSLNPREAELVGFAICTDPDVGCYIPVGHRGTDVPQLPLSRVVEGLRPFLEDPRYRKIGQNLKYDWSVLAEQGLKPIGIGADTMVAAYVLDPEGRHSLQALAAKYLNYTVMVYEEVCGKGKDQICFDQVPIPLATRYSAEDAAIAVRLWNALKPELEREGLMPVFDAIDLPIVPILSKMERQGVCIDEEWLRTLSREFDRELRRIEERVQAYVNRPFNLNSPKQLAQLLFEELKLPAQSKTKTGYSTDASVLYALAPLHEVPRLLLEYREIAKLKGTYVDPLPGMRDRKTRKIHASFHQTVAATGRLSSSDPNLQNIPVRTERSLRIRRGFLPSPGNCLVSADYSQIELRILAHMSADPALVAAFQNDQDVHRKTAADIFGVTEAEVSDRQRGIAKAINFGLMYGKTAFGLAQELQISRTEAKAIIDRYFVKYHAVKSYLDRTIEEARERGYVLTLSGRKRRLPDLRSKNPAIRANAERMAMNTPIQGTAADLMKLAMIRLDEALEKGGYRSKLIIQVHDEFLLDCPMDEAEKVRKLLVDVMEGAMTFSVPLRVNTAVGENWMEL